jgi:hypothetical protein
MGMCHPGVNGGRPVSNDACIEELRLNLAALEDARNRDVYGWIGVGVGVAALGVGLVLLLTGDDPGRYDHKAGEDVFAIHDARPLAWADAHGGGLGMSGRF